MEIQILLSKLKDKLRKWNPLPEKWQLRYQRIYSRKPVLTKVVIALGILFLFFIVTASTFTFLLFQGKFGSIPSTASLQDIDHNLASEVYSADGVLLGRYYIENRRPATLEEIPDCLKDALIAAEDARFYKHNGIDYRALGRVLVKTLLLQDDDSGGGSTITQQLAKNLYPRKKHPFFSLAINKAREMVIATRLEKVYSKEEIIALYLNTIPFSGNVFGIKTAANRFFNTSPSELKPEQAAVLVGMLKATTAYHPLKNPERSKLRRNTVLARMERNGFLTRPELDSLQKLPLVLDYKVRTHNEGLCTYFREHLRLELEKSLEKYVNVDGNPYNIYTDGLKIYTTIDSKMQQFAEKAAEVEMRSIQSRFFNAAKKHKEVKPYGNDNLLQQQLNLSERVRIMEGRKATKQEIEASLKTPVKMTLLNWRNGQEVDTMLSPRDSMKYYLSLLNTGFLAADHKTGRILAWVGGVNFKYVKYDHIKSKRQVGSTFKPVLYAAALESGMNPCKNWHNKHITYEEFDNWAPKNVDEKYGGYYNMEGALSRSINTIAVQVFLELTSEPVLAMAKRMGVNSPIPKEAGVALGGVDLTLMEMVSVFATIANQGKRPTLHYITKVETKEGEVLEGFEAPNPKSFVKAMSEQHATMMRHFLTQVVLNGKGTAHGFLRQFKQKVPVAAKTGTSNDNRDGWFLGFTPDVTFGTWVGGEHPQVRFAETRLGQGSSTAMPICANFLNQYYGAKENRKLLKNKFSEIDSLTLDRLDCYGLRHPKEIDSTRTDSLRWPASALQKLRQKLKEKF